MTRNIEIKVYLDIDEYNKAVESAKTRKMVYKTGSEMIRKILYDYNDKIMSLVDANVLIEMKLSEYKTQVAQNNTIIENYQKIVRDKETEIETLKNNLNLNISKRRKK